MQSTGMPKYDFIIMNKREAARTEKKIIFLMAGPFRGGGGGRDINENFCLFLLLFKNKRYFT